MSDLRGEYWITEDGVDLADGDAGDMNHEMYVVDHVRGQIAELLQISLAKRDLNVIDTDIGWDKLQSALINAFGSLSKAEVKLGLDPELIPIAAYTYPEIREYAMEKWGWKRVQGESIETWTLTDADKKIIFNGMRDIIEMESDVDDPIDEWDLELSIYCYKSKKQYYMTFEDLKKSSRPSNRAEIDQRNAAANKQGANLDRSSIMYYANKPLGDSKIKSSAIIEFRVRLERALSNL